MPPSKSLSTTWPGKSSSTGERADRARPRPSTSAGSTGVPLSAEAHVAEALLCARELGLTAYKMRLTGDLADDVAAIQAVRNFASADLDIMLDAGGRYSGASAEALAKKLKSCAIRWLENPFEGHQALLELKQLALIPLAAGRREPNELRYMDLIDTRAVDYVQMDLVAQGGYATARRLFPDIARAGLRFAFRWISARRSNWPQRRNLGACWPESMVRWLEYPLYLTGTRKFLYPFPLAAEILKHPLPVERGSLVVPNGPGLGVDIDESVIWRYPWSAGPWSYFNLDSPAATWALTADNWQILEQNLPDQSLRIRRELAVHAQASVESMSFQ